MKKIVLMILLLSVSFLQTVAARETGGYAGSFLRYGLDARSEAMGRAMVADVNSSFSAYFNPAAISYVESPEIMTNYRSLSLDRKFMYVGYAMPIKAKKIKNKAAISVGYLYSGTSDIDSRDFDGNKIDTFSFNENMFHITFSIMPKDYISIGVTSKILYARFPEFNGLNETESSTGIAIDAGVNVAIPSYRDLKVALAVKDLKGKYSWDSKKVWSEGYQKTDNFPTTVLYGFSWSPKLYDGLVVNAALETREKDTIYNLGAEYKHDFDDKAVLIRGGSRDSSLAFGFGLEFDIYGYTTVFDYAYTYEDITPDDPQTVSLRVLF